MAGWHLGGPAPDGLHRWEAVRAGSQALPPLANPKGIAALYRRVLDLLRTERAGFHGVPRLVRRSGPAPKGGSILCFCGAARVLGGLRFCRGTSRPLGGLQPGSAANEGGNEPDPVGDNEI